MSPDDPRHGTPHGRRAHRRDGEPACDPCKAANALYQRRYRKTRALYGDLSVSPVGSARRVQALMWLGWSLPEIAARMGMTATQLWVTTQQKYVTVRTADRIAAVYEDLCMTLPRADTKAQRISVSRTRGHARRNGYAPPLAWDDDTIDDPDASPVGCDADRPDFDTSVVERILSGEFRLRATPLERREVARRWAADDRSLNDLGRLTGWRVARYFKVSDDQEAVSA